MKTKDVFFENQNQNFIFQELKLFNMKVIHKYFVCVCELEQSTTNLFFTCYLNTNLKLTNKASRFKNLLFILTLTKLDL